MSNEKNEKSEQFEKKTVYKITNLKAYWDNKFSSH